MIDSEGERSPTHAGRTLVVAPEPPWPTTNGIRTKVAGFVKQLGAGVDVISPAGDTAHTLSHGASWTTFVPQPKRLSPIRALATGNLPIAGRLPAEVVLPLVSDLLDSGTNYDVIHLDTLATIHLAAPLRRLMSDRSQSPIVVASINDSYSLLLSGGGFNDCLGTRLYCRYVKAIERRLLPNADFVDVVSENDVGWLRELVPAAHPRLIPLGIDTAAFDGPRLRSEWDVLYLGTMAAPAFHWLQMGFDVILSRMRARLPNTRIAVAGPDATEEAKAYFSRNGVQNLGFVGDLSRLLRSSRTLVVSSRQRSGTPTKALQAMAAGTPVVGMEALDGIPQGKDGVSFSRASSWIDLADRVIRVLQDEEHALRLGHGGRLLVEQQHEWAVVRGRYFDFSGDPYRGYSC